MMLLQYLSIKSLTCYIYVNEFALLEHLENLEQSICSQYQNTKIELPKVKSLVRLDTCAGCGKG
jgi:hypothetical protein